jgi:hypothetical protein
VPRRCGHALRVYAVVVRAFPEFQLGRLCLPGGTALACDSKPYGSESGKHKQRFEDQIRLRVGDVMKSKNPMDPHDIKAEDQAYAREHAQEERVRFGAPAPQQKSNQNGYGDDDNRELLHWTVDRKDRKGEDDVHWRAG